MTNARWAARHRGPWPIVLGFAAACALGTTIATAAAAALEPPTSRRFDLPIAAGNLPAELRTLHVTQGDRLELHWTADEAMTLHLHGYDIKIDLAPKQPVVTQFVANIAGRFPIERHGGARREALCYIEVYPR